MKRHPLVRTSVISIAAIAATVALTAGPALAGPRPRVGPHQAFDGLVNGKRAGASILVGCPGAITPGETGHPLGGQTVEVRLGPTVSTQSGNTGDSATSIVAFFGPPPPTASVMVPAARSTVTFRRYSLVRPIPTSIELPCSGTGQVTFIPFPRTPPTSRPSVVPVTYEDPEDSH